jgi:hypothetical protein
VSATLSILDLKETKYSALIKSLECRKACHIEVPGRAIAQAFGRGSQVWRKRSGRKLGMRVGLSRFVLVKRQRDCASLIAVFRESGSSY